MAECTKAERELLDAMWESLRKHKLYGCPYCTYDALGPASKNIENAMVSVFEESSVFTAEEADRIAFSNSLEKS